MKSKYLYFLLFFTTLLSFGCAVTESQIKIEKSGVSYFKPQNSTKFIKGEIVNYVLWYDENKWSVCDPKHPFYEFMKKGLQNQGQELGYVILSKSNEVVAIVGNESRITTSFESSYKFASELARRRGDHLISKEIRTVNGNDVLYMKTSFVIDSEKWVYLFYFYSNKAGSMSVMTHTPEKLFTKYEKDMFDLLNGLADSNSILQSSVNTQDIENKLLKLETLLKKGLITSDDYEKKKTELLNSF